MSDTKEKKSALLDQQVALSAYLGSLLGESVSEASKVETGSPVAAKTLVEEAPTAQARLVEPVVTAPAVETIVKEKWAEPVLAPRVLTPAADIPGVVADTVAAPVVKVAPPLTPANGRPDWAQNEFQSLLFQVAGLTLAVPLAKLNGVTPWDVDQVTPMPGHSALFLGVLGYHEHKVKVVDAAQVVLPADRLAALDVAPEGRISHVVLVGEHRWGLACSSIGEVVSLGPGDVKWRTAQGKRPWLAGTVVQHMCALVDVEAFISLLEEGNYEN